MKDCNSLVKGYLIQDFEAGFNPLSDGYLVAENSFCNWQKLQALR